MDTRVREMVGAAGLPMAAELELVPNSRRSLMLGELARDHDVHPAVHARLFDAYWARGLDLGDEAVLVAEGGAAGLPEDEIRAALDEPAYAARISEQTEAVLELGAGGVPAWLIDERLLVPGAQPHEVFDRVLARLGHEPLDA